MHKKSAVFTLIKFSRLLILLLLLVFFSIFTDSFWSLTDWGNVANIFIQQAPFLIILSFSMALPIILKGIDLSIGSNISLTSCVAALILQATYNIPLGILGGIGLGVIIGLINGVLISCVRVSPFIATYSTQWILRGLAYVFVGGKQIDELGPDFRSLFTSNEFTFFIIAMVVAGVLWFVMSRTTFGRNVYAYGSNEQAARLSGVNTKRVNITAYVIGGGLAALTGIMYIANLGCAEPVIGENFPLQAIAAVLIGGITFVGGEGSMVKPVVGAFIMVTLTNGMIHAGVPSHWQQFVIGAVIVLSMMLERGAKKLLELTEKKV